MQAAQAGGHVQLATILSQAQHLLDEDGVESDNFDGQHPTPASSAAHVEKLKQQDRRRRMTGKETLICCGALWTPRCHLPSHDTVL